MARIHVCPLAGFDELARSSGAGSVVSLLSPGHRMPALPASVTRHLHLTLSDIAEPMDGHVLAGASDIARLLAFLHAWDRQADLILHCYAGVSRSTAAAFIACCALEPARSEAAHALRLRQASPSATPNPRLVALADAALDRQGRMIEAARAIGRGADCYAGNVFALDLPAHVGGADPTKMG